MLGVTPEMAFFFILFSNCQSSVGQTKNLMGFVNSSIVSTSGLRHKQNIILYQWKVFPYDNEKISVSC